jgi:hypothetical protein
LKAIMALVRETISFSVKATAAIMLIITQILNIKNECNNHIYMNQNTPKMVHFSGNFELPTHYFRLCVVCESMIENHNVI